MKWHGCMPLSCNMMKKSHKMLGAAGRLRPELQVSRSNTMCPPHPGRSRSRQLQGRPITEQISVDPFRLGRLDRLDILQNFSTCDSRRRKLKARLSSNQCHPDWSTLWLPLLPRTPQQGQHLKPAVERRFRPCHLSLAKGDGPAIFQSVGNLSRSLLVQPRSQTRHTPTKATLLLDFITQARLLPLLARSPP